MSLKASPKTQWRAGKLRAKQTLPEELLWARIRAHRFQGVSFRRQHAIGPYIVDFYAPSEKLVIELDGSQHLDQGVYDAQRSAYLQAKGCRVLRFWNNDILNNLENVLAEIASQLSHDSAPPLPTLPKS